MGSTPTAGSIFYVKSTSDLVQNEVDFFLKWLYVILYVMLLGLWADFFSRIRIKLREQFNEVVEVFHTVVSFGQ